MLIDLDFVTSDPLAEPAPRRRSRVAVWLIVAMAMSIVGGAENVPVPGVRLVAEIKGDRVIGLAVFGNDLFVSTETGLSAYDIRDGARRWHLQIGLSASNLLLSDGLLLLGGADRRQRSTVVETAGVDAATGALLWRLDGWANRFSKDLVAVTRETLSPVGSEERDNVVAFHRSSDGALVWILNQVGLIAVMPDLALAAALDPATGEYTEWKVPGGTMQRQAILPDVQDATFFYYGNGVLTAMSESGIVARFDARSLAQIPSTGSETDLRKDCGLVWCDINQMVPGYVLVDKATGARVMEDLRWQEAILTAAGVVGVIFSDNGMPKVLSVFDPRTGAITDVTGWTVIGFEYQPASGESTYLLRGAGDLTHFARLGHSGFAYVGAVPRVTVQACSSAGQYVACHFGSDLVRIWRLT